MPKHNKQLKTLSFCIAGMICIFSFGIASLAQERSNKQKSRHSNSNKNNSSYIPLDGDIVFQISQSRQSLAIQLATKSKYSHMGIVYLQDGDPYVFEAVQPVKTTPLNEWVARGQDGHFVAKRLSNSSDLLTSNTLTRMKEIGREFEGKDYDLYFEWSDESIYCSELVWKIYNRALSISIGELKTMSDFDLSDPVVKQNIEKRWGDSIPLDETVISPASMFNSELLELVFSE